jgi:hypothetical protein
MAQGTTPTIPHFKVYGGSSASSVEDASGAVFYANAGWLNGTFGTYVFRVDPRGTVQQIPLSPQPTARGVLEANEYGLAFTTVIDGKFVRYEIEEYTTPTEAGGTPPVRTGSEAEAQLTAALEGLHKRLGGAEVTLTAMVTKNASQDQRLAALEAKDADFARRLAALTVEHGITLHDLRTYLWNDRFMIDLFFDILHNRRDAGIRNAIRAVVQEELRTTTPSRKGNV